MSSIDPMEDLMLLEGGDFFTWHKLDGPQPAGTDKTMPPGYQKGIYIDTDKPANDGQYFGRWEDIYGNQFQVELGSAGGGGSQKPACMFLPIQVNKYVSEAAGGGRFADPKAYIVY